MGAEWFGVSRRSSPESDQTIQQDFPLNIKSLTKKTPKEHQQQNNDTLKRRPARRPARRRARRRARRPARRPARPRRS